MRLLPIAAATLFLSSFAQPAAASPDWVHQPQFLTPTLRSGGDNPRLMSTQAERLLEELNSLCSSRRAKDQQRCTQAWNEINAAYAQLHARKAAATSTD